MQYILTPKDISSDSDFQTAFAVDRECISHAVCALQLLTREEMGGREGLV